MPVRWAVLLEARLRAMASLRALRAWIMITVRPHSRVIPVPRDTLPVPHAGCLDGVVCVDPDTGTGIGARPAPWSALRFYTCQMSVLPLRQYYHMPVVRMGFRKGTWSVLTETPVVCTLCECLLRFDVRRGVACLRLRAPTIAALRLCARTVE